MPRGRDRAAAAMTSPAGAAARPTRDRLAIALVVLAALTRVVAALALGSSFHFVDETIYVDAARHLLSGGGFGESYRNVPAQPVWLALLAAPWPEQLTWVRATHAIATGLIGGLVLHALGTRIVGAAAARVALAFYALDPLLVVAGGLLYPEATAAVVLTAVLLATVTAAERDDTRATVIAGLLLGLAVLFRPVAIVLVPVFVLWIGVVGVVTARRRLVHALAFTAACALAVSPWVLHNLARDGAIVPRGMAGLQNAPVSKHDIGERGLAASLVHQTAAKPATLARRVARELGHFWEPYPTRLATDEPERRDRLHALDTRLPRDTTFPSGLRDTVSALSFGLEMGLVAVGLALAGRPRRAAIVLIVAVALAYGLGYALFVAKLRYRIVVLPGLFLLAGLGAVLLRARLGAAAPDIVAAAEPRG
jgi:4-amino-4-deoxy-L-arabinose transferase-like glycosyltransferase